MSSEKQTESKVVSSQHVVVDAQPSPDIDVLNLKVDEDFDAGGDPYNRTGSHCVVNLKDVE